jgi:hypothetical protein
MKFFGYIKKLINRKSNESSKRFIALSITCLVVFTTIYYTSRDNIVLVLAELLSFILVLMGVTVWENIKNK